MLTKPTQTRGWQIDRYQVLLETVYGTIHENFDNGKLDQAGNSYQGRVDLGLLKRTPAFRNLKQCFRKMDCGSLAPSKTPTTSPIEFISQSPSLIPTAMPTWYYQHADFKDNITDLQEWNTRLDAQVQFQKNLIEYQTAIIADLAAKVKTSKETQADLDSKLDSTRKLIRDAVVSMQTKLISVDNDYIISSSCSAAGVLISQCTPKVTAVANHITLTAAAGDVTVDSHRCGVVSPCTSSLQISAIAEALAELKDI